MELAILPKKSVATITSGLRNMVSELKAHAEAQVAKNSADVEKKAEIDRKIAERDVEIAQAQKIAAKIGDLIEA